MEGERVTVKERDARSNRMNGLRTLMAAAAFFCALPAGAEVEVVPLKHRTAEQVIPILRPLVEQGGVVTGMQNQLVIRAGRKNIAELRRVLDSIDVAQRRLMIYVRHDSAGGAQVRGADARVEIGSEARASARIIDSRSAAEERMVQQVQAMDGAPATIQIGQSVPVSSRTMARTAGGGVFVSDSVTYRDVTVGFEVVPRITGERVVLEISPRRDTPGPDGSVNIQRISSTASGRLGEWFELGGLAQDESRESSGLIAGTSSLRQDNRRVWVKVEEIR